MASCWTDAITFGSHMKFLIRRTGDCKHVGNNLPMDFDPLQNSSVAMSHVSSGVGVLMNLMYASWKNL